MPWGLFSVAVVVPFREVDLTFTEEPFDIYGMIFDFHGKIFSHLLPLFKFKGGGIVIFQYQSGIELLACLACHPLEDWGTSGGE